MGPRIWPWCSWGDVGSGFLQPVAKGPSARHSGWPRLGKTVERSELIKTSSSHAYRRRADTRCKRRTSGCVQDQEIKFVVHKWLCFGSAQALVSVGEVTWKHIRHRGHCAPSIASKATLSTTVFETAFEEHGPKEYPIVHLVMDANPVPFRPIRRCEAVTRHAAGSIDTIGHLSASRRPASVSVGRCVKRIARSASLRLRLNSPNSVQTTLNSMPGFCRSRNCQTNGDKITIEKYLGTGDAQAAGQIADPLP